MPIDLTHTDSFVRRHVGLSEEDIRQMIEALGLWISDLSLPGRALIVVDAANRLRFCAVAARLEDEVSFEDALSPLRTIR